MTGLAVDILLPFYDPRYLRATVESVLSQSAQGWRLICIDDCSPDADAEGVRWLRELSDPRVRYVRNPKNLGVAANFVRAIELVEAPWFVMLGEDDEMFPGYVQIVQTETVRSSLVDAVQPGVQVIDEIGRRSSPLADRVKDLLRPRVRGRSRIVGGEEMAHSLARGDWAYFPSILWRTSTVKRLGLDTKYVVALDWGLLFDIALEGGSISLLSDVCFRYRRHRRSASRVAAEEGFRFRQERALLNEYALRFADAGWISSARIARRATIPRLNALMHALAAGLRGEGRRAARLMRHAV